MFNLRNAFLWIAVLATTCFTACEKTNLDDPFKPIETYSRDSRVNMPDSLQFQRLRDEFAAEHQLMRDEFERLDAVAYKRYWTLLEQLDTASSQKIVESVLTMIRSEYTPLWDQVMVNLNFDKAVIRNRAAAILGAIPFELGPYLEITGTQTLLRNTSTTPADTTFFFHGPNRQGNLRGCEPGAFARVWANGENMQVHSSAIVAGWCQLHGRIRSGFNADTRFRHVRSELDIKQGKLRVFAAGLGGFSSESKISFRFRNASGNVFIDREVACVWTAAAAWGSDREIQISGLGMTIASNMSAFENGGGSIEFQATTLVRGGGLGVSKSWAYINSIEPFKLTFFN